MKSTDVIVGGLLILLIAASGVFFMQMVEVQHELEKQGGMIEEAGRGMDFVPMKEMNAFRREIEDRMGDLSREMNRVETVPAKPAENEPNGENIENLRRETETGLADMRREITDIRNEIRNMRSDIDRMRMAR
ncbi:MAG: hypothetical protein ABIG55_06620 [Candidatus Omnitrophota bacterium]|nr:hypothetical protein [Candidatus Omnitrophota bacterium]